MENGLISETITEIEDRFKLYKGSLVLYPHFGLMDVANIQTGTPNLKINLDDMCEGKFVYQQSPNIMGIKVYSTTTNALHTSNNQRVYQDIHIGAKFYEKSWGIGGVEFQKSLDDEIDKWIGENHRLFEVLSQIGKMGAGVRMELTSSVQHVRETVQTLTDWIQSCRLKRGDDTGDDRMIVCYRSDVLIPFLKQRVSSIIDHMRLLINRMMDGEMVANPQNLIWCDFLLKKLLWDGDCSRIPREIQDMWRTGNWLMVHDTEEDGEMKLFAQPEVDLLPIINQILFEAGKSKNALNLSEFDMLRDGIDYIETCKRIYLDGDRTLMRKKGARYLQLLRVLKCYYFSLGTNLSSNRPLLPQNEGWSKVMAGYDSNTLSYLIEESNFHLERGLEENGKIDGWKTILSLPMEINQAGERDLRRLLNNDNGWWKKFSFWLLFQRLTGVDGYDLLGNLGSRETYLKEMKEILCLGSLVIHQASMTRFAVSSSIFFSFTRGDVPASWILYSMNDPPLNLEEVYHNFQEEVPSSSSSSEEEEKSPSSSSEEEEELRDWTNRDSAKLLFLIDYEGRKKKWRDIKNKYFNDCSLGENAIRMKYERVKILQRAFKSDRRGRKGKEYMVVDYYLQNMIRDTEMEEESEEEEEEEVEQPLVKKLRKFMK